jgi:SSS family solute:Na+ symporter
MKRIVVLAVALYRTSQVKTKADYLVAGRSLPAVVLVLTLLTSWIGAGIALCRGGERLQERLCRAVAAGRAAGWGCC